MCRWLVYKGQPILLDDLLCRCTHSLIHQSLEGRFTPGQENPLRNHMVNGDGFGIAWYECPLFYEYCNNRFEHVDDISLRVSQADINDINSTISYRKPTLYKSLEPAWNDANLKEIAGAVISPLVFAHVRAATHGGIVSRSNCHPFRYGPFAFMHNGGISMWEGPKGVKALLHTIIPAFLREKIEGNTDSEVIFALFLSLLPAHLEDFPPTKIPRFTAEELSQTLTSTIDIIEYTTKRVGGGPSSMNFAITDGKSVVATRYRGDGAPPSLYFFHGVNKRIRVNSTGHMHAESCINGGNFCIVSSEPLTNCSEDLEDWQTIPANHLLTLPDDNKAEPTLTPITISPVSSDIEKVFAQLDNLEQISKIWRKRHSCHSLTSLVSH